MPITQNTWATKPFYWLHRVCQYCGCSDLSGSAYAGDGTTIGACGKPKCAALSIVDGKAAMNHSGNVAREDIADDPLWAALGITPECFLGSGKAPSNLLCRRSSGSIEPGFRVDTACCAARPLDISRNKDGRWGVPVAGSVFKLMPIEDLKMSLDEAHWSLLTAFEERCANIYKAEAADHALRAAVPNPHPIVRDAFAYLKEAGKLPKSRPFATYAVLPAADMSRANRTVLCGAYQCYHKVVGTVSSTDWHFHYCDKHKLAADLSCKAFMHDNGTENAAASEAHDALLRKTVVPLVDVKDDPLFEMLVNVVVIRSNGDMELDWTVAVEDPAYQDEPLYLVRTSESAPWTMLVVSPEAAITKTIPVGWLTKSLPEEKHALVEAFIKRLDERAA